MRGGGGRGLAGGGEGRVPTATAAVAAAAAAPHPPTHPSRSLQLTRITARGRSCFCSGCRRAGRAARSRRARGVGWGGGRGGRRVQGCRRALLVFRGARPNTHPHTHYPTRATPKPTPTRLQLVLHTGDFRYHPRMASHPALVGARVDTLILDTTYCAPKWNFPPQEVRARCVRCATSSESRRPPRWAPGAPSLRTLARANTHTPSHTHARPLSLSGGGRHGGAAAGRGGAGLPRNPLCGRGLPHW